MKLSETIDQTFSPRINLFEIEKNYIFRYPIPPLMQRTISLCSCKILLNERPAAAAVTTFGGEGSFRVGGGGVNENKGGSSRLLYPPARLRDQRGGLNPASVGLISLVLAARQISRTRDRLDRA